MAIHAYTKTFEITLETTVLFKVFADNDGEISAAHAASEDPTHNITFPNVIREAYKHGEIAAWLEEIKTSGINKDLEAFTDIELKLELGSRNLLNEK